MTKLVNKFLVLKNEMDKLIQERDSQRWDLEKSRRRDKLREKMNMIFCSKLNQDETEELVKIVRRNDVVKIG